MTESDYNVPLIARGFSFDAMQLIKIFDQQDNKGSGKWLLAQISKQACSYSNIEVLWEKLTDIVLDKVSSVMSTQRLYHLASDLALQNYIDPLKPFLTDKLLK